MKSKVKTGNENKPWTANYPELEAWLDRHGARCLWQVAWDKGCDPSAYVECWQFAGGRQVVLLVWANRLGWEIYTPCGSLKVDEMLDDAERRLGIQSQDKTASTDVREPFPDESGPWNE